MTEVQYFPSIDDKFNKKVAKLCEFAKIKLFCEPTKNETPVIWGLPGIENADSPVSRGAFHNR